MVYIANKGLIFASGGNMVTTLLGRGFVDFRLAIEKERKPLPVRISCYAYATRRHYKQAE